MKLLLVVTLSLLLSQSAYATDERTLCAIHEAAHAVTAQLLGMQVLKISVTEHCGSTIYSAPRYMPTEEALVCLAGGEAESIAGGDWRGSKEDLENAARWLGQNPCVLIPQVREMLLANWCLVKHLADMLLQEER